MPLALRATGVGCHWRWVPLASRQCFLHSDNSISEKRIQSNDSEPTKMPSRFHRKLVKHAHEAGYHHELTFSCYRRLPLLDDDDRRGYLASSIAKACVATGAGLIAFVFMPEHVHLLVRPDDHDPKLPAFLAACKRPVSAQVRADLERIKSQMLTQLMIRERPGKMSFRFWQEGPGYDRNLNNPKTILAAIDYLHLNPVRRGLCDRAIDWTWSSANYFVTDRQRTDERHPPLTQLSFEAIE